MPNHATTIAQTDPSSKTKELSQESLRLHQLYKGKVESTLKCPVRGWDDFALWYTPGVAEPCRHIEADPEKAFELTSKWNRIAVVSDCTRVLGLGDIGPMAGLPVMEGKCLLFKYLGGVDAVPVTLGTKDPDEIIRTVKLLQPAFGGVNLEDISTPKCFRILDTLREEAEIPIFHDDQQGTATVVLAALINALKLVNKKIDEVVVAFVGCGAANVASARLLIAAGASAGLCRMVDSKGLLHSSRGDIEKARGELSKKWGLCLETNEEKKTGGIPEALEGADICVAMSKSSPGTIKPEWVSRMNKDSIMFPLANPDPEIWPHLASEAGARIVATGRSDFPNQVNNSMGFPGIFRGMLDVRASTITDEMCIAAAEALASRAEETGLDENHIMPLMDDGEAFLQEAVAVGMKAQEQGVAQLKVERELLRKNASEMIGRSQNMTKLLMREGLIEEA